MYGPGLPPHEILAIVRASGLMPLSQPVRRGPGAYVLVAGGPSGEQVQVVVDAYAGNIRRVNPIAMQPCEKAPAGSGLSLRSEDARCRRRARIQGAAAPRLHAGRSHPDSGATLTPPAAFPIRGSPMPRPSIRKLRLQNRSTHRCRGRDLTSPRRRRLRRRPFRRRLPHRCKRKLLPRPWLNRRSRPSPRRRQWRR